MLWAVQHKWSSGTQFTLNCYRHWDKLVIRDGGGTGQFLYINEGFTNGYPLAMIAYGFLIIPLIR